MLKIKKVGGNETIVMTGEYDILYSYETPVAAIHCNSGHGIRTQKKWSLTTSRAVTKFMQGNAKTCEEVSQEMLEALPVGSL